MFDVNDFYELLDKVKENLDSDEIKNMVSDRSKQFSERSE